MTTETERVELNDRVEYRLNGLRHRIDGPAIDFEWVKKEWYIEGKEVSKQEVDKLRCHLFLKALIVNRRSYKYF